MPSAVLVRGAFPRPRPDRRVPGTWPRGPPPCTAAATLGKISKEQLAADFPVWHTSLHNPDWAAYARLCGAIGIKADCRDQLDQAMTQLFAADGPAMLHVSQDPELL